MAEGPPPLPTEVEPIQPKKIESRDRLPIVEVSNEVFWVNQEVKAPFDMKEGEPTKLGVFISNESQERSIGTVMNHGRTGILGKVIFEDTLGRKYRDVDAKGIGHVGYNTALYPEAKEFYDRTAGPYASSNPGGLGLMDRSVALKDASMAEELLSHGIRTYRVIGITKLNELIVQVPDGSGNLKEEKISIAEAKQRKMIAENIEPVVEVRAFGTRARVQDVNEGTAYSDAIKLVRQELDIPYEEFQSKEYLHWYAQMLGTSVGRLHKQKLTHGFLTPHNLTLDCRIVDLDSIKMQQDVPDLSIVTSSSPQDKVDICQESYVADFERALGTLNSLDYSHVLDSIYTEAYRKAVLEAVPPPLPKSAIDTV